MHDNILMHSRRFNYDLNGRKDSITYNYVNQAALDLIGAILRGNVEDVEQAYYRCAFLDVQDISLFQRVPLDAAIL